MAKKIETATSVARFKKLQEAVEKEQQSIERTEIIPIDAIQFNKDNSFNIDDSEDSIAELAKNIKENGLLHNIVVTEIAPKQYLLISGERRTRAMQYLGENKIRATIKKNLSDLEVLKLLFFANSETREYTIEEKVHIVEQFLARLKEFENTDEKESASKFKEYVAQAFGVGERQASKLISISTELLSELKEMLFNDTIDTNTAAALAQLPESYQRSAAEIIRSNLSESDTDKKYAVEQALDFAKRAKNVIAKTNTALAKQNANKMYNSAKLTQTEHELANLDNADLETRQNLEKKVSKYKSKLEQIDKDIAIEEQKKDNEVAKIFSNTISSVEKGLDDVQKDESGEIAQAKIIERKVHEIETALKKLTIMKPTKELSDIQALIEQYKSKLEI